MTDTIKHPSILSQYPFLSLLTYGGDSYIGIIQNRDDIITSFYYYNAIPSKNLRQKFLELGEQWWWESNRQIPINVFLRKDWVVFKPYLRTFNSKDVTLDFGPCVSLSTLSSKRGKRKSITLVRKVD